MVKKIIAVSAMMLGMTAISASAQEALYSDIDTYINHYPISAYAVDGKMAVVAEDLRDYGFNVEWDGAARALHISRNEAVTQLVRKDIYDPAYPSGTKFSDIYASDITVDYNGTPLTSYALNGYTLIPINDFAVLAGSEEWLGDVRAYKVWVDGLSMCEYMPLTQRCRNLWYQTNYGQTMPTIDIWEDMNSDGQYENVVLSAAENGEWGDLSAELKIGTLASGDFLRQKEAYDIEAVYIMDLVPNDHAKEIAVISNCVSDDPMIKILRCDGSSITQMNFDIWDKWSGKSEIRQEFWLGYVEAYPFILHEDGTFTLQTQTDSWGMWDVYTTYKINEHGNIVLIPQEVYTVIEASRYGADPWGYYRVDKTLLGRGLNLYEGDYIKPILDDQNNNILLQKSNGEQGWFAIDGYNYGSGEISRLFVLAG